MDWARMKLAALGLSCLAAVGCQNKLQDENKALWQQNRELQSRLADSEGRLRSAPDPAALAQLQSELAMRDKQIADLQSSLRQPTPGTPEPGLEGIDATYDPRAGTVTVALPGDVLFSSGMAALKPTATRTLDKIVAAIRKDYPGKKVYVDGHTDTDPISKSRNQWDDNLELSAARAMTVARYLNSHGLAPKNVVVRAYGEHQPKSTKPASRRVEIVVQVK